MGPGLLRYPDLQASQPPGVGPARGESGGVPFAHPQPEVESGRDRDAVALGDLSNAAELTDALVIEPPSGTVVS